ncbi:MAG TPA: glycoside hydrolase family 13 protein [Candidatus Mediterraneibacter gallistercoris]|uniref:Glycoside hydrolase family 13 protein n=1 Tax=Candidatus Mediterraneibacter gallistercoris TaxID=2838671 RepID=A0A9D2T398_9FIRM|nr:glycoside hydrolase family 13 protein [Candidatus Mediterraneibacter gallistercoris]
MTQTEKMDKAAILHVPLSQYAFATSEYTITIRLRAKKSDLTRCVLYTADRVCRTTPICFAGTDMKICAVDECFEYYEANLQLPYNRICYYFKLEKGKEWTYYYADRFTKELPDRVVDGKLIDGRSEYYQYPFILRDEIPDVPEWFKEAVVYNIFPDSFANGKCALQVRKKEQLLENGVTVKARLGGTLNGITENLDYIKKMGFNCLYLNPIFTAGEYHKYDVVDYYHIDPCFGTEEDFRRLVEDAHDRGMHIIIDGVFNHCSWRFFAFEDVVKNGEKSRYKSWFYDLTFPVRRPDDSDKIPGYTCFAYERKMPKLNTSNREVQLYFADVGTYWIEKYHIDGWRLDVANEISREFWRIFRNAVKTAKSEAVLIGEVWENAHSWLKGDAFDSTMNYEFRRICMDYLADEQPDGITAAYEFEKMRLRYPDNIVRGQLNLLDSHDVPRFLSMCRGDGSLWKLGCILLILMPGVPSLFYGDECGMEGVLEEEYRQPMLWERKDTFGDFICQIITIRNDYIDGKTGYSPLWELIRGGVFAFTRPGINWTLRVIINAGTEPLYCPVAVDERILMTSSIDREENTIEKKGYRITLNKK